MSRFSYTRTITTDRTPEECLAAVERTVDSLGGAVLERSTASPPPATADEQLVESRFGSEAKVRLFGAYLLPASDLPVRARVAIADHDARRVITVTAAEDFGFGTLWPAEERFRQRCQVVAAEITAGVARRLAA